MKIETNIPMPTPRASRGTHSALVKDMQIGDSFILESGEQYEDVKRRTAVNCTARYYGMKVTCRKVLEDGAWKLRFWRVS